MPKKVKQNKKENTGESPDKKFHVPVVTSSIDGDHFNYSAVFKTGEDDSISRSIDMIREITFNGASTFTFQEYSNRLKDPQNLKLSISSKMQAMINRVVYGKIENRVFYQSLIDEAAISDYKFNVYPSLVINLLDIFTEKELQFISEPYLKTKSLCLTEVIFSVKPEGSKGFVDRLKIIVGLILPHITQYNIGYANEKDRNGNIAQSGNDYIIEEITTGQGSSIVYTCKNKIEPFILIDKIKTKNINIDYGPLHKQFTGLHEYIVSDNENKFDLSSNHFFNKIMSRDREDSNYTMRFKSGSDNSKIENNVVEYLDLSYGSGVSDYGLLDYIYKTIDTAICKLGYVGISRAQLEELCRPNPLQEKIDEEKKRKKICLDKNSNNEKKI